MIIFHNDFIFERRGAVSKKDCDNLIRYFENNPEKHTEGKLAHNRIDHEVKKSKDIMFVPSDASDRRIRKVIDPVMKVLQDSFMNFYEPRFHTSLNLLDPFEVCPSFNLQKYEPGEGFYGWHNESGSLAHSHRKLVWMVYLNDVENGGTEFLNQNLTVQARTGTVLIWAGDWTHTHRGQRGAETCKYILTGWYTLNINTL